MPVPTLITDLSTTASSNSPSDSETPGEGDDHIRALAAFIAQLNVGKIDRTGSVAATANLPMGGFKHTGAGAATASGQYLVYGQSSMSFTGVDGDRLADFDGNQGDGRHLRMPYNLFAGAAGNGYPVFGFNTVPQIGLTYNYAATDFASVVLYTAGGFQFLTAPSGTAGNAITFTARMSIAETGAVSIPGVVTAGGFVGPLTGNVTGNASGSSGSCTGNAATATTATTATTAAALTTARAINNINFDGSAAIGLGTFRIWQSWTTLNLTSTSFVTMNTGGTVTAERNGFTATAPYSGFIRFRAAQISIYQAAGVTGNVNIRVAVNGVNVQPELTFNVAASGGLVYGSLDVVQPVTAGQTIDIVAKVASSMDVQIGFVAPGFEMISST